MWITREALAEAGKCIAQNGERQAVQIDTFVCVSGGGSYSASGSVEPEAEEAHEGAACEFVPWPLDPLSGAALPFSWSQSGTGTDTSVGAGVGVGVLSVVGDACYAAETLAAWVKEDARLRGVPLALARVSLPATGAEVASRLLHRAATLGGEVLLETLSASEES